MGHLSIFGNILILTIGFAALHQGIQLYRVYRFPAVRSFLLFLACSNIMDLISLVAQYIFRNVYSLSPDGMYILVFVITGSAGFVFAAIEIAFFASTRCCSSSV